MYAKKIISIILFFVAFASLSFAQTEQLNRFDGAGKKDGKWIAYLDKNWKHIDDSANAVYYRYTFYDHGTNLYPMGPCGGKGFRLEMPVDSSKQSGKIKLLDGEYKWYDDKGQLSSTHILKNGEYVSCKEYYPTGQLRQQFDYTKKWQEQAHTWYVAIYDKQGNLKLDYYFHPDKNGRWPATRG